MKKVHYPIAIQTSDKDGKYSFFLKQYMETTYQRPLTSYLPQRLTGMQP